MKNKSFMLNGIVLGLIAAVTCILYARKMKTNNAVISSQQSVSAPKVEYQAYHTREELHKLICKNGLSSKWTEIASLIRDEVRIHAEPGEKIETGCSKIGGLPDLPKEATWYYEDNGTPLAFIAQINCSELSDERLEIDLPSHGMMYFFYMANQDAWGFDPKDKDKFKVLYLENAKDLRPHKAPVGLKEEDIFKSCRIKFSSKLSVPSVYDSRIVEILDKDQQQLYADITEDPSEELIHKIAGYADAIQGEMELECQLVTNGLYCGDQSGYNDPRRQELEKGADDWQLLLQVDSDEEHTRMMWGDAGRLYFWIKKQDLHKRDFSKCWFSLQCY